MPWSLALSVLARALIRHSLCYIAAEICLRKAVKADISGGKSQSSFYLHTARASCNVGGLELLPEVEANCPATHGFNDWEFRFDSFPMAVVEVSRSPL